jgi:hypothetical protein
LVKNQAFISPEKNQRNQLVHSFNNNLEYINQEIQEIDEIDDFRNIVNIDKKFIDF